MRPCCDPIGGGGRAAPRQRPQHREGPASTTNLSREEAAAGGGEIIWAERLRPIAPRRSRPPPEFTTRQGRTGQPSCKERWRIRFLRMTAAPACALTWARASPPMRGVNVSVANCGAVMKSWCASSISKAGRPVSEPSLVRFRQGAASIKDGTLSCNLPQQAGA